MYFKRGRETRLFNPYSYVSSQSCMTNLLPNTVRSLRHRSSKRADLQDDINSVIRVIVQGDEYDLALLPGNKL